MPDLRCEWSEALLAVLACPVCGAGLSPDASGGSLVCPGEVSERNPRGRAHCFDGAAGGYIPLCPSHSGGGDSREAVRARTAFLTAGYYAGPAAAIAAAVRDYTPAGGRVLDAGCGEGYYTARFAADGYPTMGVDLSKFAVEAAAKAARRERGSGESRTLYATASVFELPVQPASMDTLVNIFAPCAPREFARVLRPGGHLIVAGAGERHLMGLKKLLYDDPYLNDPRRDLPGEGEELELLEIREVTDTVTVRGREHIAALFSMTPYYWRTPRDSRERLAAAEELATEVAFRLHIYQRT